MPRAADKRKKGGVLKEDSWERKLDAFRAAWPKSKYDMSRCAQELDIAYKTLQNWLTRPEFREALNEINDQIDAQIYAKHVQGALDGNLQQVRFHLTHRHPDFKKVTEVRHSGNITHTHGEILKAMTVEEKDAEIRRLTQNEDPVQDAEFTEVE